MLFRLSKVETRNRTVKQGPNIKMASMSFVPDFVSAIVGACAVAFGSRDQQVVPDGRQSTGIPFSRNEAQSFIRQWKYDAPLCQPCSVEYCNRINRGVGHEQTLAIGRLGKRIGISSGEFLLRKSSGRKMDQFSGHGINCGQRVGVRKCNVKQLFILAEEHGGGMGSGSNLGFGL